MFVVLKQNHEIFRNVSINNYEIIIFKEIWLIIQIQSLVNCLMQDIIFIEETGAVVNKVFLL